jgi:hypothetical protein
VNNGVQCTARKYRSNYYKQHFSKKIKPSQFYLPESQLKHLHSQTFERGRGEGREGRRETDGQTDIEMRRKGEQENRLAED